jgi:hypothetical protein
MTAEPSPWDVNLVATIVPEASFLVQVGGRGVSVQVGGVAGQIKGSHMALFSAVRSELPALAGNYRWIPGTRGSNPDAAWPPLGARVEFDHSLSCQVVDDDGAESSSNELITVTIRYEQYAATSGFSRRVVFSHNCSGALLIQQNNVAYFNLIENGHVELESDTESSLTKSVHLVDNSSSIGFVKVLVQVPYSSGEGAVGLASGQSFEGYLLAEIWHSTPEWDPSALGGVDRYARETARFWRLVAPQIEQMVVYVQGICVGGNKTYPPTLNDGTVGYWCYDDEGTEGMQLLIDQTKEMKTDMLVFGQNMNQVRDPVAHSHLPHTTHTNPAFLCSPGGR